MPLSTQVGRSPDLQEVRRSLRTPFSRSARVFAALLLPNLPPRLRGSRDLGQSPGLLSGWRPFGYRQAVPSGWGLLGPGKLCFQALPPPVRDSAKPSAAGVKG
jgi:hypothetical protein